MPNWCYTNITIHYNDKDKLKNFYNLIEEWTNKNYMENGFGLYWLGNIVGNSGIGTIDKGVDTDLRCRGSLIDINLSNDELAISTETAWCPYLKMWIKLVDKYLPEAELIYSSDECGNGLYATNDPYLLGTYIIDSEQDEIENNYEATKEELIEILQDLLKTKESNLTDLMKLLEESEFYDSIWFHEWEYADIHDWD